MPVACSTKQQKSVALSSAEAEYVAITHAVTGPIWLQGMIKELAMTVLQHDMSNEIKREREEQGKEVGEVFEEEKKKPSIMHCDSQSAMTIARNPVQHQKTKHIDLSHHFIRQLVEDQIIDLHFFKSEDQLVVLLTKPLPQPRFEMLRSKCQIETLEATKGDVGT